MDDKDDLIQLQWNSLNEEFAKLEDHHKKFKQYKKDTLSEKNICEKEIKAIKIKIHNISDYIKKKKLDKSFEEDETFKKLVKDVNAKKELLADIQMGLPRENGKYLNIILGSVNVTLHDQDSRFKYKCEYERFKLLVNAFIVLTTLISVSIRYRFIDAILHFLLVWYHCTLTIRESILIVNGSRIKGWWRSLQFITTISSGIMIVWPDGIMYDEFRMQYLSYILYTSFLQFLQFYYQQGVLYRLRALGERYDMDVTIQGWVSWMWSGLSFLLPFLYIGYIFQFYNSYTLFKLSQRNECDEWQIPVSSFIFFIIFLGNTITTSFSIYEKLSKKIREELEKTLAKYKSN